MLDKSIKQMEHVYATEDILCVFTNGIKIHLSAQRLDDANRWVQDNRDKLRLVHFGETGVIYKDGMIAASLVMTRQQALEGI